MDIALQDKSYRSAQDYLISNFIVSHRIEDMDEYCENIDKLQNRPVKDDTYTSRTIESMQSAFLNGLDPKAKEFLKGGLNKYNEIAEKLHDKESLKFFDFEHNGKTISFDKDKNIKGGYKTFHGAFTQCQMKEDAIIFENYVKDETGQNKIKNEREFILSEIDFDKKKNDLVAHRDKILNYFNPNMKYDVKMSSDMPLDIVKLDKYTLPSVGKKRKKPEVVYLAHYQDRIEVMNFAKQNCKELGDVENIQQNEYKGLVGEHTTGLVWGEELCKIDYGKKFSIRDREDSTQFLLSENEGQVECSAFHGQSVYKGKCDTLIDINGKGMYNKTHLDRVKEVQMEEK